MSLQTASVPEASDEQHASEQSAIRWELSSQNYLGWRERARLNEPPPPIQREIFDNRDAAERRKAELVADGYTACI